MKFFKWSIQSSLCHFGWLRSRNDWKHSFGLIPLLNARRNVKYSCYETKLLIVAYKSLIIWANTLNSTVPLWNPVLKQVKVAQFGFFMWKCFVQFIVYRAWRSKTWYIARISWHTHYCEGLFMKIFGYISLMQHMTQ